MASVWKRGVGQFAASAEKLRSACDLAILQEHRRALLAEERNRDGRRLAKFGYRVYSQGDEDGILREIFRRIGEGNRTFVELGAGEGIENNTLFLLVQGWRGLWVEASRRKISLARKSAARSFQETQLRIHRQFVTASNVDDTVRKHAYTAEAGLLSIDLDGNDYHILRAIRWIAPRVIVAEYNAKFPPDVNWVMAYNERHRWDSTDYFGASLKALEILLVRRGYLLVGCSLLGANAFFVRSELVNERTFCPPFTAANHYEPARYYLRVAFQSGFAPGFGPFQSIAATANKPSPSA